MTDHPRTDKIAEWQRLCDEATPGPWQTDGLGDVWGQAARTFVFTDAHTPADAAFIVAARTALPLLLAEHDLLEAAWGLIANANEGFWERARPEWTEAAVRWRDRYHAALAALETAE